MSGIDNHEEWQREDYRRLLTKPKNHKGLQDRVESRAERHTVAEKLVAMGLDGVEDVREKHQGFTIILTPPSCSKNSNKENERPHTEKSFDDL
ncbi:hypothetical protein LTR05_003235 [Lithohypha guttulata]|uniref:Uncharacterized protein n=1 Tax=Lithohypha guttulata TaxID=1690604 RepID=A0AAN7YIS0_9EURO|nr:hypothetical protein LTR05_003235 [Lithohypha guttulata]